MSNEDEITMLKKIPGRLAESVKALGSPIKVLYNHVLPDVKRDSEFLVVSKMLNPKSGHTKPAASSTSSQNYMQVTSSWANKGKAPTAQVTVTAVTAVEAQPKRGRGTGAQSSTAMRS